MVALLATLVGCSGDEGAGDAAEETATPPASTASPDDGPSTGGVDQATGMGRFLDQQVEWEGCGGGFECTRIAVPLDYDDLAGASVELAVNRLPASDPDARIGSLLLNPGGPGASGVDMLRQSAPLFGELGGAYDLVGFDPRGVGASEPLACLDTAGLDALLASDPDPDTPAEVADVAGLYRGFGRGCERDAPDLLPYMSTTDAARDLDVIRAVVGDEQLHYLGFSYGTLIGAVYAELFPDRIAAMVLDGPIDPRLSYAQTLLSQASGFETALRAYAADCVTEPECPLGTDVDTGLDRITALLEQLDAEPLPTDDPDRPLTEGLAGYGIAFALYSESYWTGLTLALSRAMDEGDGQPLLALADLYARRGEDGYAENLLQVYTAVSCLDDRGNPTIADVEQGVDEFEQASPTLGASIAWTLMACAVWPVEPAHPLPAAIDAVGAVPIVVVGTTRDPATPYAQAQSLAAQLDSGVLLSRDGDGHTAYGQGNACIDGAVNAYLLEQVAPAEGTRC
jgi:pimeloyl-ACP methyl ester carboxylesterase